MLSAQQCNRLQEAFAKGALRVQSVSPEGVTEWKRICDTQRAEVPWETIYEIHTNKGRMALTAGHRVFTSPTTKSEARHLQVGDKVLSTEGYVHILAVTQTESRQYMYDLTAEDWHNFLLEDSRAVVSNSPDKFYHFRPPEHEGQIGQYNHIFGQIWEDEELRLYLEWALDEWDTAPPHTTVRTLDHLCNDKPEWRGAIFWQAIAHACFALSCNWVADEFSLTGDTCVRVYLPNGEKVELPIGELFEIVKG